MKLYYFGCETRQGGHYLWASEWRSSWSVDNINYNELPWGAKVDGGLAPAERNARGYVQREEPQGVAALHHKDGWTAISYWDRSVDRRGASNSTFIADAVLTFDEILAAARARFPGVFSRQGFEVVLHKPAGTKDLR